jgi:hypothetical protein
MGSISIKWGSLSMPRLGLQIGEIFLRTVKFLETVYRANKKNEFKLTVDQWRSPLGIAQAV